ncbi:MAG: hypothetical protein ACLP2P_08470 [Desulfobaccales bacterium]
MITESKTFDPANFLKNLPLIPKELQNYPAWVGIKCNDGKRKFISLCKCSKGEPLRPVSAAFLDPERLKLCDGIGVLLQEEDPFVVVIFPNCILDPETNRVNPSLIAAIWRFGSYAEIISKRDIHVWGKSKLSSLFFALNYHAIPFEMVTSGFVSLSAYPLGCSNRIVFIDKILTSIQESEELKAVWAKLVEEKK